MGRQFFVIIILCFLVRPLEARWFVGAVASRFNIDFENVDTGATVEDISGTIEVLGVQGGLINVNPGNFGSEFSFAIVGANAQKLSPNPNWGSPWYWRACAKLNYTFSFKVYPFIGVDFISGMYKDAESYYLGPGIVFGIGYKVRDNVTVALGATNNSKLYAGENRRFLRGEVLELNYGF